MIDVNSPPEGQRGKCPRCKKDRLWIGEMRALNALSRRDNETYICSPCGKDEASEDYWGRALILGEEE